MNSITREQAEERLKSSNVKALRAEVLDMLFPSFKFKEGEVIAVSDIPHPGDKDWHYRQFVEMKGDKYMCRSTMSGGDTWWLHTRPLTDKERGLRT